MVNADKGWWVFDRDGWTWAHDTYTGEDCRAHYGLFVQAATRGKARVKGASEMSIAFLDAGVRRDPAVDDMTRDQMDRHQEEAGKRWLM